MAENETRIEAHAGDNFQYVPPNISPNAPTVRRTFGMTGAVVVVSINRETFPHKSGWLALKSPVKCLLALGLCSIQPAA